MNQEDPKYRSVRVPIGVVERAILELEAANEDCYSDRTAQIIRELKVTLKSLNIKEGQAVVYKDRVVYRDRIIYRESDPKQAEKTFRQPANVLSEDALLLFQKKALRCAKCDFQTSSLVEFYDHDHVKKSLGC